MTADHDFMECQPGSCALPHPMPHPEEPGCHWPYGNVFFGGIKPYHRGDPICLLTKADHRTTQETAAAASLDAARQAERGE